MSSSPKTPARAQLPDYPDLLTLFRAVPDPRDPRGVRHPLGVILAVGLGAVLAGARSFAAIGEWAADQSGEVITALGGSGANRPTESTIPGLLTSGLRTWCLYSRRSQPVGLHVCR